MALPNFLIIGERRSGTSTLAKWIEAHPEIYLYPRLDIAYFMDEDLVGRRVWKDGKEDYDKWEVEHSKEEYSRYFEDATNEKAIGEKSADYLFWTPAHQRIKTMLPDVKLVVTLRNPIDRAYSMYWNELGKGREEKSFEEAIKAETDRIARSDYAKNHLSYIHRGYYDESLSELYKTFSPENVFVIILEDLIQNPKENLKALYAFLGVNTELGFEHINKNFNANWTLIVRPFWKKNKLLSLCEYWATKAIHLTARVLYRKNPIQKRSFIKKCSTPFRYSKSDVKMSKTLRKELVELYRPHLKKLETLIQKDVSLWLEE